jgi:hypothetical protein
VDFSAYINKDLEQLQFYFQNRGSATVHPTSSARLGNFSNGNICDDVFQFFARDLHKRVTQWLEGAWPLSVPMLTQGLRLTSLVAGFLSYVAVSGGTAAERAVLSDQLQHMVATCQQCFVALEAGDCSSTDARALFSATARVFSFSPSVQDWRLSLQAAPAMQASNCVRPDLMQLEASVAGCLRPLGQCIVDFASYLLAVDATTDSHSSSGGTGAMTSADDGFDSVSAATTAEPMLTDSAATSSPLGPSREFHGVILAAIDALHAFRSCVADAVVDSAGDWLGSILLNPATPLCAAVAGAWSLATVHFATHPHAHHHTAAVLQLLSNATFGLRVDDNFFEPGMQVAWFHLVAELAPRLGPSYRAFAESITPDKPHTDESDSSVWKSTVDCLQDWRSQLVGKNLPHNAPTAFAYTLSWPVRQALVACLFALAAADIEMPWLTGSVADQFSDKATAAAAKFVECSLSDRHPFVRHTASASFASLFRHQASSAAEVPLAANCLSMWQYLVTG